MMQFSDIPLYNLSHVVKETGIKAETIRAWERRYQLPAPQRTKGGHRLFSDYDTAILQWLVDQQQGGLSISKAAAVWKNLDANDSAPFTRASGKAQLATTPAQQTFSFNGIEGFAEKWVQACLAFDEKQAEDILTAAFSFIPAEEVIHKVLLTGLSRIGEMWYRNEASVQQEHFASELVIRRLHVLINASPAPIRQKKILIATPAGESHAIPALVMNLQLRNRGWDVVFPGTNIPSQNLAESLLIIKPSIVIETATRLSTAVKLLDISRLAREKGHLFAFGGKAFIDSPQLPDKIPGRYLGENLFNSVGVIEELIQIGQADDRPAPQASFIDRSELLRNSDSKIQMQMQQKFKQEPFPISLEEINRFLFADLMAALTFNDITLIEPNLHWVQGLLAHRGISEEVFPAYLNLFQEAVNDQLKEDGDKIHTFFQTIIEKTITKRN